MQIGPRTRLRAQKVRTPPLRMSTSKAPNIDPVLVSQEEFDNFKKQMAEMANLMKEWRKLTQALRTSMHSGPSNSSGGPTPSLINNVQVPMSTGTPTPIF